VEKEMYNTLVRGYSKNLQIATFVVLAIVNIREVREKTNKMQQLDVYF